MSLIKITWYLEHKIEHIFEYFHFILITLWIHILIQKERSKLNSNRIAIGMNVTQISVYSSCSFIIIISSIYILHIYCSILKRIHKTNSKIIVKVALLNRSMFTAASNLLFSNMLTEQKYWICDVDATRLYVAFVFFLPFWTKDVDQSI